MLLQNCWVELFVIGFAQSSHIISVPTVMSSLINFMNNAIAQEKMAPSKLKKLSEHIWKVNEFIQEINKLDVDDVEFALLRFIILFNPGKFHASSGPPNWISHSDKSQYEPHSLQIIRRSTCINAPKSAASKTSMSRHSSNKSNSCKSIPSHRPHAMRRSIKSRNYCWNWIRCGRWIPN